MDLSRIRELIELVKETGIAELEVSTGVGAQREHVRISRAVAAPAVAAAVPQAPPPPADAAAPAVAKPGATLAAPLSGTFYRAPAPGEQPFVEVGDRVAAGDVLCIIESMKMMNRVKSERGGEVTEALVEDGSPVESGAPLFRIR